MTDSKFERVGKLGCYNCYDIFFKDSKEAYLYSLKTHKFLPFLNKLEKKKSFYKDISSKEIIDLVSKIRFRHRIARNFKKQMYPIHGIDTNYILDESKNFLIARRLEMDNTQIFNIPKFELVVGDEDQIRFINFPKDLLQIENCIRIMDFFNSKTKFDSKKGLGYISSCPTNLGRGNKLSAKFSIKFGNSNEFTDLVNSGIGYRLRENHILEIGKEIEVILYIKNFNSSLLNKFIKLLILLNI
jgi:hypothetical protein